MPKGKSVYDTYFEAGASTGEYASSLQKVSDVWSSIDFSREKSTWETEQRERNLDTILAVTELGATVGGSMTGFKEGSTAIQMKQAKAGYSGTDWEEYKTTAAGKEHIELYSPKKIGRGGTPWEEGGFQNLWQRPRYQFGEDVVMSKSDIRKYGRDVKEYGKYGVDLPLDVYQSMHEEYRQGYERPKEDWYLGKHVKGALGAAKKVGQTIVPGGDPGYGDLWSRQGKTTTVAGGGYQYKKGDVSVVGSEEWFKSKVGEYKSSESFEYMTGSYSDLNPHLIELAKKSGYDPTTRKWN